LTDQANRSLRTFRIHLALTAAIATATFALVIAAAQFAPLMAQIDRNDLDWATRGGMAAYLLELHASYWPVVAVTLAASVVSGLLLFQRMTQPLVRFVRAFELIARGERPRPIVIRRTDYLSDEARALNRMLDALATRSAASDSLLARLDESLEELAVLDLDAKHSDALAAARGAADELRRALAGRD
jgi:methyl-accepting chemotaxis protein